MIKKYIVPFILLLVSFTAQADEKNIQFPPNMSEMISLMNAKEDMLKTDKLTIFIPESDDNYNYLEYLEKSKKIIEVNNDEEKRKKFLELLDIKYIYNYRNIETGLPDKQYLSNIRFVAKGAFVDIDIKNSSPKHLKISSSKSDYTVIYSYGSGYLYNTTLEINLKNRESVKENNIQDRFEFFNKKFNNYLTENGFSRQKEFFTLFKSEKKYVKDNTVIIINTPDSTTSFYDYTRDYYVFSIEIENKYINDKYKEISNQIKEDIFNKEYKDLPNILK